jgi:putative FmdB family regulatory protein
MPIYEFYCPDCHVLFRFLARRTGSRKRPACPRCRSRKMRREPSTFAVSRGLSDGAGAGETDGMDDARLERAMTEMAQEAEGLNEEDPREMGRMMRRLLDVAGLPLGAGMREAIRRLESGEDPDKIEEELGDQIEGEDGALTAEANGGGGGLRALRRKLVRPRVDPTLYEL